MLLSSCVSSSFVMYGTTTPKRETIFSGDPKHPSAECRASRPFDYYNEGPEQRDAEEKVAAINRKCAAARPSGYHTCRTEYPYYEGIGAYDHLGDYPRMYRDHHRALARAALAPFGREGRPANTGRRLA